MMKLLHGFFTSSAFRLLIRIIASLASAIVVVSGYLFFVNLSSRTREDELTEVVGDSEDEEEPSVETDLDMN